MREDFCSELVALAATDRRIVLLTADLGFRVLEPFSDRFPERFVNVGVAEQNMIGMATGMADSGYIPFVYSISTFASMRAYEFIRNGPVLHNLPVRIIAVGGGFDYGSNGPTHHAFEDIGILRLQPGLRLIVPADGAQARSALQATWQESGPVFYRLSKNMRAPIPELRGTFDPIAPTGIRSGSDVLLLALGAAAYEARHAAEELHLRGIECELQVVSSMDQACGNELRKLVSRFPLVLTVEEHYITGGLGSLVAEVLAEHSIAARLIRRGIAARLQGQSGSTDWLTAQFGASAASIVSDVEQALTIRR